MDIRTWERDQLGLITAGLHPLDAVDLNNALVGIMKLYARDEVETGPDQTNLLTAIIKIRESGDRALNHSRLFCSNCTPKYIEAELQRCEKLLQKYIATCTKSLLDVIACEELTALFNYLKAAPEDFKTFLENELRVGQDTLPVYLMGYSDFLIEQEAERLTQACLDEYLDKLQELKRSYEERFDDENRKQKFLQLSETKAIYLRKMKLRACTAIAEQLNKNDGHAWLYYLKSFIYDLTVVVPYYWELLNGGETTTESE